MDPSALTSEGVTYSSMALLGLLGTGHCVGMCGPLVLAIPAARKGLAAHIFYHAGRVITYTAVGAAVAGVGAALRHAAGASDADPLGSVARLQVILSIIAAALLLALGLARLGVIREPAMLSVATPGALPGFASVQRATRRGRLLAIFALGLLLGLLPCGLSYAAFARALTAPGPLQGALLLAAFGAGTVPGLLLLGTGGAAFARRHQKLTNLLAGLLLVAMALSVGVDALGVIF
jgi:uncharacterized protein